MVTSHWHKARLYIILTSYSDKLWSHVFLFEDTDMGTVTGIGTGTCQGIDTCTGTVKPAPTMMNTVI